MPRAWNFDEVELDNMTVDFYGRAYLVSTNLLPNPDLTDFTNVGKPEYWKLDAPDSPDGWYPYVRQINRIKPDGSTERLDQKHRKQSLGKLALGRSYFDKDGDLISGGALPDAQKRARIAPPLDIRAVVKTEKNKAVGFKAGIYYVSYFLVMGSNPISSQRITAAAPAKAISLLQGQRIGVSVPDVFGQGVTGIGFTVGRDPKNMLENRRVDIRFQSPETIVLSGFVKGRIVNTQSPNRTTVSGNAPGGVPGSGGEQSNTREVNVSGSSNSQSIERMNNGSSRAKEIVERLRSGGRSDRADVLTKALDTRFGPSGSTLAKGSVLVSFRYVADGGEGEMLSPESFAFHEDAPGMSFQFRPQSFPEEGSGYVALVFGDDGTWQRLVNPSSGGTTYAPDEWAEIVSDHVPVDADFFPDGYTPDGYTPDGYTPRPTQPMIPDLALGPGEGVSGGTLYQGVPEEGVQPTENTTDPVSIGDTVGLADESDTSVASAQDISHDAPGKDEGSVFSQAGVPYAGWHLDHNENLVIQKMNERRMQLGLPLLAHSRDLNILAYRTVGGLRDSKEPEELQGEVFSEGFLTDYDDPEEAFLRFAAKTENLYRDDIVRIGLAREPRGEGKSGFRWSVKFSDAELPEATPQDELTCMVVEPDGLSHVFKAAGHSGDGYVGSYDVGGERIEAGSPEDARETVNASANAATGMVTPDAASTEIPSGVSGDRLNYTYSGSYGYTLGNAALAWNGIAWECKKVSSGAQVTISDGDAGGHFGVTYAGGVGNTRIEFNAAECARQQPFDIQKMQSHEFGHAGGQNHRYRPERSIMIQGQLDWNSPQQLDKDLQISWHGAGGPSGSSGGSGSTGGSEGSESSSGSSGSGTTPEQEGLESPTTPLESLTAIGVERMKPGLYEVRTTYGLRDEESAPSPARQLRLRHVGGGLTDQYLRIYTPGVQRITNPEHSEEDADGLDLDWEIPSYPTGLVVSTDAGILKVNDRTNSNGASPVRIGEKFPINPVKLHTARMDLAVGDGWSGGRLSAHLSFFDAAGTLIRTVFLGKTRKKDGERVLKRFGPRNMGGRSAKCDFFVPAQAAFAQILFNLAPEFGARNAYYEVSNIGVVAGGSGGRKRLPLALGLANDRDQRRRESEAEDPKKSYPTGPYCRVVKDPDDPAFHFAPDYLERLEFDPDSQDLPAPFSLATSTGVLAVIRDGWKVYSEISRALVIEKEAGNTTETNTFVRCEPAYLPTRQKFALRGCMRVQEVWSGGTPRLLSVNRTDGSQGVEVYHTPGDSLRLVAPNGGSVVSADAEVDILSGDRLKLEVVVSGMGTSSGRVELHVWRNERRAEVVRLISLDFTGVAFQSADIGIQKLAAGQPFFCVVDRIALTKEGDLDAEYVPGNYFEYWAPEGTPPGDYFAKGMKHPLRPNEDYVVSCYVGSENVDRPADLLQLAVKTHSGGVQQSLGPMVRNLDGDMLWKRVWVHFKTRDDAVPKYLEFTGNRVGGGLVRAMGFQLDDGRTEEQGPRPFTNENALTGSITYPFTLRMPGGDLNRGSHERGTRYRRGGAVVETPDKTSFDLEYGTGGSPEGLAVGQFHPTSGDMILEEGDRNLYYKIKINVATTDPRISPFVRGAFVDFTREKPQLLRADGSEYRSGCLALGLPAPEPRRKIVAQEYADGSEGFEDLTLGTPPRYFSGFDLECFRDSTATEIMSDRGAGEGIFIIEARGKRYRVRLSADSMTGAVFAVNRSEHRRETTDEDGLWRHRASGLSARIISVEVF